MTGVAKNTVAKLLVDLGSACSEYQNEVMRDLPCKRLEVDEIWSFCHAKQANVPEKHKGEYGYGDVWTYTAIDSDSKLVPAWMLGDRGEEDALVFISDLADRMAGPVQLTTDGHRPYLVAVDEVFGNHIDYAVIRKLYGVPRPHWMSPKVRRPDTPSQCIAAKKEVISGRPDHGYISTSYVERQNLTMRMSMRRFTRSTNAFSKKVENLAAAVSLHFMHYNFARKHQTLGVTPAMAAGISDHVWTVEEIVGLLERESSRQPDSN
jgi:IS1 family transposase